MVVGFGSVMLFNYIVDPFQQFRKASWYEVDFKTTDARMLIPGLARHYDYENIITGDSTAQNFTLDMISDTLHFNKPIKFVMSSERLYEVNRVLDFAFHMKKNLKNVVYPIRLPDFFTKGSVEPNAGLINQDDESHTFPDYLYRHDKRFSQIIAYLYTLRTLKKSMFYALGNGYHAEKSSRLYNLMFSWMCSKIGIKHPNPQHVIADYIKYHDKVRITDFPKEMALMGVQKIENLIKAHPTTHFIVYYIPYSVIYYKSRSIRGKTFKDSFKEMFLDFPKALSLKLLTYPNVEIHDLRTMPFVTNLDAYYDDVHFDAKTNQLILEALANKKYQLTPSNVQTFTDAFKNLVLNYHIPKELLPKTP